MIRLLSITFIISYIVACCGAERLYVNDKLVRLEPLTDEHIQYLQDLETDSSLDFWTDVVVPNRPIDVRIAASDFENYISQFEQRSLPYTVVVNDLQHIIDEEQKQLEQDMMMRQAQSRLLGQPRVNIVGTYASYNDMVTYMEDLAAANPSTISVSNIGPTYQNRPIKLISLKYNPSSTRNIWIDCGIHAREWITPAVCIWMIEKLIQEYNNNDPITRDLLNYWTVYIAPSLNPDGYEFSRTSTRLWRKNRKNNNYLNCYGVDLNRNYPWKWMTGGASTSPCSETFGGPSAASEIETVNVVNFLQSKMGTWDMYMSFHSYGQWWFTPYGYTSALPADYNKQLALAQLGASAIQAVNRTAYTCGSVARLLYIASGSTVDWAYDVLKIPYSYTIELPPLSSDSSTGFVLPPARAPGVCHETYVGMKAFLAEVKKQVAGTPSG